MQLQKSEKVNTVTHIGNFDPYFALQAM